MGDRGAGRGHGAVRRSVASQAGVGDRPLQRQAREPFDEPSAGPPKASRVFGHPSSPARRVSSPLVFADTVCAARMDPVMSALPADFRPPGQVTRRWRPERMPQPVRRGHPPGLERPQRCPLAPVRPCRPRPRCRCPDLAPRRPVVRARVRAAEAPHGATTFPQIPSTPGPSRLVPGFCGYRPDRAGRRLPPLRSRSPGAVREDRGRREWCRRWR